MHLQRFTLTFAKIVTSILALFVTLVIAQGGGVNTVSSNYNYYNNNAKRSATHQQKYLTDVEASVAEAIRDLKTSNSATVTLNMYKELVRDTKGTNCEVQDDGRTFSNTQQDIEVIVDNCVASAPKNDLQELEKIVTDALAKLQAADSILRSHAVDCTSDDCVEERWNAQNCITTIMLHGTNANVNYYYRNALLTPSTYGYTCISVKTKDLKEDLDSRIKAIKECKESNK